MGLHPSEHYWAKHNHRYPYQCTFPHRSPQDMDPRRVQELVSFHFLRVPFNGQAHWGFKEEHHLNQFLELVKNKG